jgi:quercetin dioxygenase-like cupin family protein
VVIASRRRPIRLHINADQEIRVKSVEQKRRTFLFSVGALGITRALAQVRAEAQAPAREGYVLAATEGEHLVHFRDHGNIFIKAGAATGSDQLALGTQQVTVGAGIPIHRHLHMDEAFYVLEGSGIVILNDARHPFERGGTIFIPRNAWHGFVNPDRELLLLWIMSPAGLDGFFRETCSPPGAPPKALTREEIKLTALKYGTEFR